LIRLPAPPFVLLLPTYAPATYASYLCPLRLVRLLMLVFTAATLHLLDLEPLVLERLPAL
jgi:hypothetical protein